MTKIGKFPAIMVVIMASTRLFSQSVIPPGSIHPPSSSKFVNGYISAQIDPKTDHSGLSIELWEVRSTPYTRSHGTSEWMVKWASKKVGDQVEIGVLCGESKSVECGSSSIVRVPFDPKALPAIRYPLFSIPMSEVLAIRLTVLKEGRVVVRSEFR